MKRTIVNAGGKNNDGRTPSDTVTPTTPTADVEPSDTPETIEEERKRSVSDLEKGLNGSEDGTVDVKDEIEEGYAKKM